MKLLDQKQVSQQLHISKGSCWQLLLSKKIIKSLDDGKVGLFSARTKTSKHKQKHQSTSQNIKAQAKTSRREPKCSSAGQSIKAQAKIYKHEPNCPCASQNIQAQAQSMSRIFKAKAKTSSANQNIIVQAKAGMSKHEPKYQSMG